MRKIAIFAFLLSFLIGGNIRGIRDNVGFCTKPYQIEEIVKISTKMESNTLKNEPISGFIAVISPHDDHILAGRVYVHAIPKIAQAKTVVIFAVTHHAPRVELNNPRNLLIFDDFDSWKAPYGPVPVDKELRTYIKNHLKRKDFIVSNKAQSLEHSAEAMLAFLQYYNRKAKILTIMVTEMDFWKMKEISERLAHVFNSYFKEKNMKPGKDISFIISTDTTHYGPDFNYAPFGVDERAHKFATAQDVELGEKFLSGQISIEKVRSFADRLWGEGITWCGRFSVPFGLMTLIHLAKMEGKHLQGLALRYGDSYSFGVLPVFKKGIGTTAPFSLKHWVGYWAIGYRMR